MIALLNPLYFVIGILDLLAKESLDLDALGKPKAADKIENTEKIVLKMLTSLLGCFIILIVLAVLLGELAPIFFSETSQVPSAEGPATGSSPLSKILLVLVPALIGVLLYQLAKKLVKSYIRISKVGWEICHKGRETKSSLAEKIAEILIKNRGGQ